MELKRILAKDLRAATEKAVSLYGTDALVVSHEQVNGQTEVIVAVDIEPSFKREDLELADLNENGDVIRAAAEAQGEDCSEAEAVNNTATETPEFEAIFAQTLIPSGKGGKGKRAKSPAKAESSSQDEPEDLSATIPSAREQINTASLTNGQAANKSNHHESHREQLRAREIVDIVRQEMAVLRRELRLQQQLSSFGPVGLSSMGQTLNSALETLGVSTASRILLIDEIQSEESIEAAVEKAEAILTASLPKTITQVPTQGIHAVFGPSGAGKTQSIARLAQKAAETWGAEQVAVISYCDNRLGAWSQLQLSCSRLGLEAFRVTEANLLRSLIDELKGRRAIFIDSPGLQMKMHCEEIARQLPKAALHLALPCDISLAHALQLFKLCGWDDVILTKLDESAQCWGLVQALQQKPLALMNEASAGVGQASATNSGEALARLAKSQLLATAQDCLAQEAAQGISGLSANAMATISSGFQPTQAVLAPKHSS
jgi:flagellar biosynthesis protein FlhF